MIKRLFLLSFVLFLTACTSGMERPESLQIEILDYGIFPGLGSDEMIYGATPVIRTDTVPFEPGTSYGVIFKVNGAPLGLKVPIKLQQAVTPASTTGKRRLARLLQAKQRIVTIGGTATMVVRIGSQSYSRPFRDLLFITDMDGNVLARKELTVVDRTE